MMIVLDTSAAISIALQNEDGLALREYVLRNERILAPMLFQYEVTNTLWKYVKAGYLSVREAQSCIEDALELVDAFIEPTDYVTEALFEATHLRHPAYDLFYLLLARRTGAALLTLDSKLLTLCERCGVDCLTIVNC